jgi:hypothetical protein
MLTIASKIHATRAGRSASNGKHASVIGAGIRDSRRASRTCASANALVSMSVPVGLWRLSLPPKSNRHERSDRTSAFSRRQSPGAGRPGRVQWRPSNRPAARRRAIGMPRKGASAPTDADDRFTIHATRAGRSASNGKQVSVIGAGIRDNRRARRTCAFCECARQHVGAGWDCGGSRFRTDPSVRGLDSARPLLSSRRGRRHVPRRTLQRGVGRFQRRLLCRATDNLARPAACRLPANDRLEAEEFATHDLAFGVDELRQRGVRAGERKGIAQAKGEPPGSRARLWRRGAAYAPWYRRLLDRTRRANSGSSAPPSTRAIVPPGPGLWNGRQAQLIADRLARQPNTAGSRPFHKPARGRRRLLLRLAAALAGGSVFAGRASRWRTRPRLPDSAGCRSVALAPGMATNQQRLVSLEVV